MTAAGFNNVIEPLGVVVAITPVTNPTSTVIYKALMNLKARNAMVLCAHPSAAKSSKEALRILHDAAVSAGAPPGILSAPEEMISKEEISYLMRHPKTAIVWATGGADMVRAAKAAGKHGSLV